MSTIPELLKQAKAAMEKSLESVRREFASVRTGRATTALLDMVRVDAYGNMMPLNQVASVAAPEPKLLTITPWDKSLAKAIEKAIVVSDLGLTPSSRRHRDPHPDPGADGRAPQGAHEGGAQVRGGRPRRHPPRADRRHRQGQEAGARVGRREEALPKRTCRSCTTKK